jgi:hypothetical protein
MNAALLIASLLAADEEPPDVSGRVALEERPVGVHAAVSLGLISIDANAAGLYGFASCAVGIALLSEGRFTVGVLGIGYSFALSPPGETMWVIDMFAEATGGQLMIASSSQPSMVGGFGLGFGFRWLHQSGFVLGFKLPIVGVATAGSARMNIGDALGAFYWANVLSLPLMSLGYRF